MIGKKKPAPTHVNTKVMTKSGKDSKRKLELRGLSLMKIDLSAHYQFNGEKNMILPKCKYIIK